MDRDGIVDQVSALLADVAELLRLRGALARSEVTRTVRKALLGLALILIAFVLVLFAAPVGLVVLILLLSTVLPPWAAAAVVLVIALATAGVLLLIARRLLTVKLRFVADLTADWRAVRAAMGPTDAAAAGGTETEP